MEKEPCFFFPFLPELIWKLRLHVCLYFIYIRIGAGSYENFPTYVQEPYSRQETTERPPSLLLLLVLSLLLYSTSDCVYRILLVLPYYQILPFFIMFALLSLSFLWVSKEIFAWDFHSSRNQRNCVSFVLHTFFLPSLLFRWFCFTVVYLIFFSFFLKRKG